MSNVTSLGPPPSRKPPPSDLRVVFSPIVTLSISVLDDTDPMASATTHGAPNFVGDCSYGLVPHAQAVPR
jgi:hypothetical protein